MAYIHGFRRWVRSPHPARICSLWSLATRCSATLRRHRLLPQYLYDFELQTWWKGKMLRDQFGQVVDPCFFYCAHYDEETATCTDYDNRPDMCAGYPWYGRSRTRKRSCRRCAASEPT